MARIPSSSLRATLAQNIKAFRDERKLSQEQLAELCGLHRTYIGSVERQERNATLSTLEVLSGALGISVQELLAKKTGKGRFQAAVNELGSSIEKELLQPLDGLTPAQQQWIRAAILAFGMPRVFWRAPDSDMVTQTVLENLGDRLLSHHANSRQSLSKDRFEFALEAALNASNMPAELVKSRTNRGHDITIRSIPVSLKTEAAKNIKQSTIHVSKWMELGKGEWVLSRLRDSFLEHLRSYERIFTLRCLDTSPSRIRYELVEIPKSLLLEAKNCVLAACKDSEQRPKPGYGYVKDIAGDLKFSLYFDGGTERKLQIKHLRKDLCKVHATWIFGSAALE